MDNVDIKKPRERSKEYPQYDLKFCLELVETINSKLGNRFSNAEQLSRVFDKSITYLGSQLSSCKQYDLLDLKKGEGYKPTEYFYKVTRGRTEADKIDAIIYCLKSPSIYADLIEKFDGQTLPTDLPSIFYWDYGITEKAKDVAASVFIQNMNLFNFISDEGVLTISKEQGDRAPALAEPTNNAIPANNPSFKANNNPVLNPNSHSFDLSDVHWPTPKGFKRSDIKITNGRFVALEFPEDLNNDDIEKIKRTLDAWKD